MPDRNSKFERVHAAVGGIGRAEAMGTYYDRLARATDDVPGYLEWSMSQTRPKPPPPSKPDTILGTLKGIDFRSVDSVSRVITRLGAFEPLPLASDSDVTYLVAADPTPLYIEYPDNSSSVGLGDDDDQPPNPVNHSFFLHLKTSDSGAEIRPPQFVLPLGRLVKRQSPETEDKPVETNYAVVIDAGGNGNPVWLIYNRRPLNHETGEYPDAPIDPATMERVFPGASHNPDSISIMPRLNEWFLGGGLLKPSDIGAWINQRGSKVPVVAEVAKRAEVRDVLGPAAA